jgi:hypothetical protein
MASPGMVKSNINKNEKHAMLRLWMNYNGTNGSTPAAAVVNKSP